jgi:hypothetical protein
VFSVILKITPDHFPKNNINRLADIKSCSFPTSTRTEQVSVSLLTERPVGRAHRWIWLRFWASLTCSQLTALFRYAYCACLHGYTDHDGVMTKPQACFQRDSSSFLMPLIPWLRLFPGFPQSLQEKTDKVPSLGHPMPTYHF